jgi:hypothetical protein
MGHPDPLLPVENGGFRVVNLHCRPRMCSRAIERELTMKGGDARLAANGGLHRRHEDE